MIKRLIWTIWTPMSSVLKKADKLNLSLSLSCRLFGTKPLHELRPAYFQLDTVTRVKCESQCQHFQWTLQWRHNRLDGVSNHKPHHCLLSHLFGPRSKKTSKFCVTGLVRGIHREPVNSPHKGPVTRKMFPFDDVIMRKIIQICSMKISILFSPECVKPKTVFTVCITICFKNHIYILFQFVS